MQVLHRENPLSTDVSTSFGDYDPSADGEMTWGMAHRKASRPGYLG